MTKIGTTFITLAGDLLAPALAIAEYKNGDILAKVTTETADVRTRLSPAARSEKSALKQGFYLHPAALIDDTTAPMLAAGAAFAAADAAAPRIMIELASREDPPR